MLNAYYALCLTLSINIYYCKKKKWKKKNSHALHLILRVQHTPKKKW